MNNQQQNIPLKIILADDDIDDCNFFSKALKEIPIETKLVIVRDGEQLMEYLFENTEHLPQILFLDLSMPRKTGFECLSEIKENNKLKKLPVVVFTTSFSTGIDFERSMVDALSNIGALEYIRKPGNFEQLKQIIHASLNKLIDSKTINRIDLNDVRE